MTNTAARNRLVNQYYNSNSFNSSTNPGGFANDGHQVNFPAALKDVGDVAGDVGTDAANAATAATNAAASATQAQTAATAAQNAVAAVIVDPVDAVVQDAVIDLLLDNTAAIPPGWLTRASTASYFGPDRKLRWAALGEPRFDYSPLNGSPRGLIVEAEARSNLLRYSEDLTQSVWAKGSTTLTANVGIAPDASQSSDEVNGAVYQDYSTGAAISGWFTFSCFVEAGSATAVALQMAFSGGSTAYNATATLTFSGSTVAVAGSNGDGATKYSLEQITATIWRLAVTQSSLYGSTLIRCSVTPTAGTVRVWGAQLEAGMNASSYIATASGPVQRAAETLVIDLSGITGWNTSRGTVYAQVYPSGPANPANQVPLVSIDAASANNSLLIQTNAGKPEGVITTGGTATTLQPAGIASVTRTVAKVALAWDTQAGIGCCAAANGLTAESTAKVPPVGSTRLRLAGNAGNTMAGFAVFRRITAWADRLDATTLGHVTTL